MGSAMNETMNEAPLIRLQDIRKTYHNGDLAVEVLHGITLDILSLIHISEPTRPY